MSGIGIGFFSSGSEPFSPTDTVYTSSTSITVPAGATQIIVECIGAGGGGGAGIILGGPFQGGGGGSGGYITITKPLSGDSGKTLTIDVGFGGLGGERVDNISGEIGGYSQVAASTLTNAFTIRGVGGNPGGNGTTGGGDGGGGTGGSYSQTLGSGATGVNGNAGLDGDGTFPDDNGFGGTGLTFSGGATPYGDGGDGKVTSVGLSGSNGAVRIRFS